MGGRPVDLQQNRCLGIEQKHATQNLAKLTKSMLPPAQDCQIAYLGPLADPVEPKCYQGLAADTRGDHRPPKCNSNSSQICHQASQKTSIQASKHPFIGSQRSAAEAVAFSIRRTSSTGSSAC